MIRVLLITALLALPTGALAQGAAAERPESGTVTYLDAEAGELELNGVSYELTPGIDLSDVETGHQVSVHFTRVGDTKMVNEISLEQADD